MIFPHKVHKIWGNILTLLYKCFLSKAIGYLKQKKNGFCPGFIWNRADVLVVVKWWACTSGAGPGHLVGERQHRLPKLGMGYSVPCDILGRPWSCVELARGSCCWGISWASVGEWWDGRVSVGGQLLAGDRLVGGE